MTDLPPSIVHVFAIFSSIFSYSVYGNAIQLFVGHVLSKERHTVADALRQLGLKNIKNYSKFHWVLSGAKWSTLKAAKILLLALCKLAGDSIVISIDSTVERRKGEMIKGLGRQRDAARSTKQNKVLTIGLQWLVCSVHIKFPWASQPWACPFLTVLMPPKRPLSSSKNLSDLRQKRRHKTLNQWASQCVRLIAKWVSYAKDVTITGDSAFATYLLANTSIDNGLSLVSRLRVDARIFDFPSPCKRGRPRLVGSRLPTFDKIAKDKTRNWREAEVEWYGNERKKVEILEGTCLWYGYGIRPVPIKWVLIKNKKEVTVLFSTNLKHISEHIIETFVKRWRLEVTFEETRRHLGIETQRQWCDKAIDRTTPCIFASYSIINLMTYEAIKAEKGSVNRQETSWYKKEHACFSDVLSCLRTRILSKKYFTQFSRKSELKKNQILDIIELLAAA